MVRHKQAAPQRRGRARAAGPEHDPAEEAEEQPAKRACWSYDLPLTTPGDVGGLLLTTLSPTLDASPLTSPPVTLRVSDNAECALLDAAGQSAPCRLGAAPLPRAVALAAARLVSAKRVALQYAGGVRVVLLAGDSSEAGSREQLTLLSFLFPAHSATGVSDFSVSALYAALRRPDSACPLLSSTPAELLPTLRNYQSRAAAWMVRQERGENREDSAAPDWRRISTETCSFYLNAVTGAVRLMPPAPAPPPRGGILADEMGLGKTVEILGLLCSHRLPKPPPSAEPAALLHPAWREERTDCICGARGDGSDSDSDPPQRGRKSAHLLWVQCSLCDGWSHAQCVNYRPHSGRPRRAAASAAPDQPAAPFSCGRCAAWSASRRHSEPCGATLVICPQPILSQWHAEAVRHVRPGALSILLYGGQSQQGGSVVTAAELAAADLVLTSYDVLRAELHRDPPEVKVVEESRRVKRYPVIPSPLTRLKWWRICVDEAQQVESSAAAATAMARRLQGEHRWCVSGTPFSAHGGADDLQGLLAFLRAPPLDSPEAWRACVGARLAAGDGAGASAVLVEALRPLFWRNSRADVADELNLPPQAELTTSLRLSPIERHWYGQQHEACAGEARKALSRAQVEDEDAPLSFADARAVMRPLLRLRQAADHPQVGSSGLAGLGGGVLSMTEIHSKLAERSRVAAEEAQRAVAMDCNAAGGLSLLMNNPTAAVALYRTVLSLEAEGERAGDASGLRLDLLQRLHCRHALLHALSCASATGAPPVRTLRDEGLAGEAEALRAQYLAQHVADVAAAESERLKAVLAADAFGSPRGRAATWFLDVLAHAARGSDRGAAVAARMGEAALGRWGQSLSIPFHDATGASLSLVKELDAIEASRQRVRSVTVALAATTAAASPADVSRAGRCGVCRGAAGERGVVCAHCEAQPSFDKAELVLFGRGDVDVGAGRTAPSSAEAALRSLAAWARAEGFDDCTAHAKAHLEHLAAVRLEFAKSNASVLAQRTALAARDELEMAQQRIRLRAPSECARNGGPDPLPVYLRQSVLYAFEVEPSLLDALASKTAHEAELRAAVSQLRWLRSLQAKPGAEEVCPVCREAFGGDGASVLPCGHSFCPPCTLRLAQKAASAGGAASSAPRFRCPTCRSEAALGDVHNVDASGASAAEAARAAHSPCGALAETISAALLHPETGEAHIPMEGGFGTKIDAVVRRLLWLRNTQPSAKSLVFSEWADVLLVLAQALKKNNLPALRCGAGGGAKGAQASLSAFRQADGAANILLLPISRGANGLTLVEATHVFLLEPLLDQSAEQQAVKRVDRIGQKESTCVHRFVVRESVEVNVAALRERRAAEEAGGARPAGLRASDVSALLGDSR